MEDKKILSFKNLYPEDLLQLELDEIKLKKNFPNIFKKFLQEKNNQQDNDVDQVKLFDDIFFNFYNSKKLSCEFANEIYKEKNIILINLKNNTQQKIKNTSTINFHGSVYDGHSIYVVSDYFLLVHIVIASFQASSLGIWDTRIDDWCFTHSEEGFYPTSFKYQKNDDSFSISSTCYYFGDGEQERKFVIDRYRKLIEVEN